MGYREIHAIIKSHDIVTFQEAMKGAHLIKNFPGYQSFHFPQLTKHKLTKKDSGGMLILISNKIYEYVQVQRESDCLVWIHIRGKSISFPYVINVGVTYIPPEGSPYAVANDFENICESIRNKSKTGLVFICGDTNSRTSGISDYVPLHVCEDLPDLTAAQANTLYRNNVDRTVNSCGRRLIDLCKYTGLQICNGRLCASKHTCCKYNGESVVDYLLAPSNFLTWSEISRSLIN